MRKVLLSSPYHTQPQLLELTMTSIKTSELHKVETRDKDLWADILDAIALPFSKMSLVKKPEQAKRMRSCFSNEKMVKNSPVTFVPPACLLHRQAVKTQPLPRRPAPLFVVQDDFKPELTREIEKHKHYDLDFSLPQRVGRRGQEQKEFPHPPHLTMRTKPQSEFKPVTRQQQSSPPPVNSHEQAAVCAKPDISLNELAARVMNGSIQEFVPKFQMKTNVDDDIPKDGYAVDVCGFSPDVTEDLIMEYVKSFGEVLRMKVFQCGDTVNARAWMKSASSCEWLISCMDGESSVMGDPERIIYVSYAK